MAQQRPTRRHTEIVLQFPIQVGTETIDRVFVMRPRGSEFRLVPAPSPGGAPLHAGDYHPFAAKLCGLTVTELELLEAEDYQRVMEAAQEFASEFPPTGSSVSPGSPGSYTSADPTS